jgi:RNA repair, ligase-Pnkp-associating, region of Hen1
MSQQATDASHRLIISNMLLTITTTQRPATDLGYLLHKNPANLHSFDLSFGKAHVFYPEAEGIQNTNVDLSRVISSFPDFDADSERLSL